MVDKNHSSQADTNQESFRVTVDLIKNYAIFTLNTDGYITSWNKGAERITGWREAEALNRHFGFLFADESVSQRKTQAILQTSKKRGIYEEEGFVNKKDGKTFLADMTISPVHDEREDLVAYISVIRDITERKQAETRQSDANLLLQREIERRKKIEADLTLSNEELDAFASAASHDLQEPLRMIVSYLQLIQRRYTDRLDQDGLDFLQFAIEGASRMRMLINDLVEYSRLDTLGKPFVQTDTTEALQRAISNISVAVDETHTQITYDKLPMLQADSVQLTRLFQNLLANAIKFRREEEPPRIHVGVEERAQEWVFRVEDNGRGIDEKYLHEVFLIFKQLGKRSERTGSGIGLAIAKKIVTRHHGSIWVDSTVGEGSTFYFSIPKNMPQKEENHG